MIRQFEHQFLLVVFLFCQFSIYLAAERPDLNNSNRYLSAVWEFADNTLKYGRVGVTTARRTRAYECFS